MVIPSPKLCTVVCNKLCEAFSDWPQVQPLITILKFAMTFISNDAFCIINSGSISSLSNHSTLLLKDKIILAVSAEHSNNGMGDAWNVLAMNFDSTNANGRAALNDLDKECQLHHVPKMGKQECWIVRMKGVLENGVNGSCS